MLCDSQWYADTDSKTWLLNDNTVLETYCQPHVNFEIKVIISEVKGLLYHIKPLWIDPNR
jgi:hypothetical protein